GSLIELSGSHSQLHSCVSKLKENPFGVPAVRCGNGREKNCIRGCSWPSGEINHQLPTQVYHVLIVPIAAASNSAASALSRSGVAALTVRTAVFISVLGSPYSPSRMGALVSSPPCSRLRHNASGSRGANG